jgi:Uma2 family endonuclease
LLKPPRYRDFAVPEYWVVDAASGTVEVHRLRSPIEPEVHAGVVRWQPEPTRPPHELPVADVFAAA